MKRKALFNWLAALSLILASAVSLINASVAVADSNALSHATTQMILSDNFDRPDGPVGNGWSSWWDGVFEHPNTSIVNGELMTLGFPSQAGGIFRSLPITFPVAFSFDFRTFSQVFQCGSGPFNDGGWVIAFNMPASSLAPNSGTATDTAQVMFIHFSGSRSVVRGYLTQDGMVFSNLADQVPGQRDYQATPTSHIEGTINPDLSATITIHYNDGQTPDPVTVSFGPAIGAVTDPPGSILVLGNSNCSSGPHVFDNFELHQVDYSATLAATLGIPEVYPGDTVNVALDIQNADNLYAAQALCSVNPAILEPQAGVFGDFFDPVNRLVGANVVSPTAGTWFGAISQRSPAEPLSGDGLFATVTYQATSPGTTSITCEVLLSDRDGFVLPVSFVGAEVTVLPYAGIEGQVTRQGREDDHSNIEVKAEGPFTYTTSTAGSGDFVFAEIRAAAGQTTAVYTVTADAPSYLPTCKTIDVVLGETTVLSPTALRGGDVNDDGVINIGDAALIADNFGLPASEADPWANINADGMVNVQDLAILGGNYELAGCQPWQ